MTTINSVIKNTPAAERSATLVCLNEKDKIRFWPNKFTENHFELSKNQISCIEHFCPTFF